MMNPKVKELWIEALRSGDYKQTINYLRDDVGYCCLGVLCNIYLEQVSDDCKWTEDNNFQYPYEYEDDLFAYEAESLPQCVIDWSDLPDENPDIVAKDMDLATLNDEGASFKEIADLIEEEL